MASSNTETLINQTNIMTLLYTKCLGLVIGTIWIAIQEIVDKKRNFRLHPYSARGYWNATPACSIVLGVYVACTPIVLGEMWQIHGQILDMPLKYT